MRALMTMLTCAYGHVSSAVATLVLSKSMENTLCSIMFRLSQFATSACFSLVFENLSVTKRREDG